MTDERADRIAFTDEEAAFLRHVRFGELPGRVPPDDRVELTETDDKQDIPMHLGDPQAWYHLRTGGAA